MIPRTHNDYRYNTVAIAAHNAIDDDARLLVCLPIAHNFPLACPGIAGFFFAGRPVVLSTSTNPADLVRAHRPPSHHPPRDGSRLSSSAASTIRRSPTPTCRRSE